MHPEHPRRPSHVPLLAPSRAPVVTKFRQELANFLSKADLLRATGNAFSVPIVTSVVRECLMLLAAPHLLGAVGLPASLPGGWLVPSDMEEHLRKRRRLNIERSRLAISERRFVLLSHRRDR